MALTSKLKPASPAGIGISGCSSESRLIPTFEVIYISLLKDKANKFNKIVRSELPATGLKFIKNIWPFLSLVLWEIKGKYLFSSSVKSRARPSSAIFNLEFAEFKLNKVVKVESGCFVRNISDIVYSLFLLIFIQTICLSKSSTLLL